MTKLAEAVRLRKLQEATKTEKALLHLIKTIAEFLETMITFKLQPFS